MTKRVEYGLLGLILAVGAWLRFSHTQVLQLQSDEAIAAHLALQFVREGIFPQAGLMSSVGVTNPPLFIYLLIPLFAISAQPEAVELMIAVLALGAVVVCWHVGRTYYGKVAGLAAAAMFAVSPWAVIYSRQIWAQDIVPIVSTLTIWPLHSLILGKRPKAIFWVIFLGSCVAQIHFGGLALVVGIGVILLVVRPRTDWRYAIAGVAAAIVLVMPYIAFQVKNDWADFRRAMQTVGGKDYQIPKGMTVHPQSGHRLPRREQLGFAVNIMNAGQIEDVLGLTADRRFDVWGVYSKIKGGRPVYFSETLTMGDWLPALQRWLFVAALIYLAVVAGRSLQASPRLPFIKVKEDSRARAAWLLVLWFTVPVIVFWAAGLWTYLTYFVILWPVHFLVLGWAAQIVAEKIKAGAGRALLYGGFTVVLVGNVVFMLDFYRFVERGGGALGTYGTVLPYKRQAAKFLADRLDPEQVELVYRLSLNPREFAQKRGVELPQLLQQVRFVQMDQPGRFELPQLDLPLLIRLVAKEPPANPLPPDTVVIVVDGNRAHLGPQDWQQLAALAQTNFGPMHLLFTRPGQAQETR